LGGHAENLKVIKSNRDMGMVKDDVKKEVYIVYRGTDFA
jgi:hypothetical protein